MITFLRSTILGAVALALFPAGVRAGTPEIRIFGSADEIVAEYKRTDYWGKIEPGATIEVPPYLTVATSPTWNKDSACLPGEGKKVLCDPRMSRTRKCAKWAFWVRA